MFFKNSYVMTPPAHDDTLQISGCILHRRGIVVLLRVNRHMNLSWGPFSCVLLRPAFFRQVHSDRREAVQGIMGRLAEDLVHTFRSTFAL